MLINCLIPFLRNSTTKCTGLFKLYISSFLSSLICVRRWAGRIHSRADTLKRDLTQPSERALTQTSWQEQCGLFYVCATILSALPSILIIGYDRYPLHKRQRRRALFRSSVTFRNISSLSFKVIHLERRRVWCLRHVNVQSEVGGWNGQIDGSIICCVCACVLHIEILIMPLEWRTDWQEDLIRLLFCGIGDKRELRVIVAIRLDLWAIITCWSASQIIILRIIGQAGQSIIQSVSQSVCCVW